MCIEEEVDRRCCHKEGERVVLVLGSITLPCGPDHNLF